MTWDAEKAHTTLETLAKLLYEHKETLGTGALTNEEQLADEASAIPALTQQEGVPSVSESIEACEEVCTFVETIDSSIGTDFDKLHICINWYIRKECV